MKRYLAYIRVSTVRQGDEGSSLVEQRAAIEAFARRNGIEIEQWFEETVTAAKRGRPEFARLTQMLRRGEAEGLVLHKIDRGARNLKDWADLGELIDAGVEILFAHEGLDMSTRGGRLAADIQAVVAADYIRNLRQEVLKGFYGRLKQGLYPLPAPRGYLDNGTGKPKTIDPVLGPKIRQAFLRYMSGNVSLEILRHELARDGILGSTGKPLSPDALSSMLRNPFYFGIIRIVRTSESFEGVHEPLIEKSVFDRVQAVMDGRLYPRLQKHTYLFRRMIICGACGRSLTAERQKGRVYYRCHDRGCRGVSIAESAVEELLSDEITKLEFPDEDLGDLRDMFREKWEEERKSEGLMVQRWDRDMALVDQRLQRLTDALLDGAIDIEAHNERKATLLNQKNELKERRFGASNLTFWETVSERFELWIAAQNKAFSPNPDEKRDTVKILGSNFVARGKSLEFPMYYPFDAIRKWSLTRHGGPHRGAVRTIPHSDAPVTETGRNIELPNKVPQVPKSPTRLRRLGKRRLKQVADAIAAHRIHPHRLDGSCDLGTPLRPQVLATG